MDDRWRTEWCWAIAAGVVPLAVALLSLSYQGGSLWLLPALVGGVAASLVLVELGTRNDSVRPARAPATGRERYTTPSKDDRR